MKIITQVNNVSINVKFYKSGHHDGIEPMPCKLTIL